MRNSPLSEWKFFKELVPTLQRIVLLYNAGGENSAHLMRLALIQKLAPNLRLKLTEKPIKSTENIEQALSSVQKILRMGCLLSAPVSSRVVLKT
jgi:ABC-type uncharacterized transport system substrate-binding protein